MGGWVTAPDDQKQGVNKEYGDSQRKDEQERMRRNDQFSYVDWKSKSNLRQGWKMKIPSYINHVSYSASNNHDVEEHIEYEITSEKDLLESISKVVYQEGNIDVDPYTAVVDSVW